jgi:predicted dehydrogenase
MCAMTDRLRVGLVGAGPWATAVHAPMLAAHDGTELVGVWARRPEAAAALAAAHGAQPYDSVSALIGAVDAVAFAVPPAVQVPFAIEAAQAGRHLILEKPIAGTAEDAERLADAVATAGVASIVLLVMRFAPEVEEWLGTVTSAGGWQAGTGRWLSGALLGGPFSASPWRHEDGALADVGPHVVDLVDAALGEVTEVLAARRAEPDLWHLILGHAGGATSTVSMSLRLPLLPTIASVDLYGQYGHSALVPRSTSSEDCYRAMLDDLLAMVRDGATEHPCDVRRGLHLQRVLSAARACCDR